VNLDLGIQNPKPSAFFWRKKKGLALVPEE
jgi:hypothetical protein